MSYRAPATDDDRVPDLRDGVPLPRRRFIERGFLRPGDPAAQGWIDAPTLHLLPGEREKFEAQARAGLGRRYEPEKTRG